MTRYSWIVEFLALVCLGTWFSLIGSELIGKRAKDWRRPILKVLGPTLIVVAVTFAVCHFLGVPGIASDLGKRGP